MPYKSEQELILERILKRQDEILEALASVTAAMQKVAPLIDTQAEQTRQLIAILHRILDTAPLPTPDTNKLPHP